MKNTMERVVAEEDLADPPPPLLFILSLSFSILLSPFSLFSAVWPSLLLSFVSSEGRRAMDAEAEVVVDVVDSNGSDEGEGRGERGGGDIRIFLSVHLHLCNVEVGCRWSGRILFLLFAFFIFVFFLLFVLGVEEVGGEIGGAVEARRKMKEQAFLMRLGEWLVAKVVCILTIIKCFVINEKRIQEGDG